MNKNKWYLLVSLSCIHLFFINVKDSHDWGDDFAQYIHQGKNIVEGIPQSQTGYLFNENYSLLGPICYPPGFPLLLAPVYSWKGIDIKSFSYLISAFLFASFFLSFILFRKYFSSLVSWLLVLVIAFNPWILNFKMEINSDIPFTFFLLCCLLLYKSHAIKYADGVLLGILTAFLISIRTIGFTFFLAVVTDQVLTFFKERKTGKVSFIFPLSFLGTVAMIYFLINKFIFDLPSLLFYKTGNSYFSNDAITVIFNNLAYYAEVIKSFFMVSNHPFFFITVFLSSGFLFLSVLGFIIKAKSGLDVKELFFVIYLLVIVIYPYGGSGYRFLLPVTPLFIMYAATATRFIFRALVFKRKYLFIGIIAFLFYLNYKPELEKIMDSQNTIINGPLSTESKAAFEQIQRRVKTNERILFIKPRVLALFTERICFANNPWGDPVKIKGQLRENSIQYILVNDEISDKGIKDFIHDNDSLVTLVWSNPSFRLYGFKN